jgi:hypothetical protein
LPTLWAGTRSGGHYGQWSRRRAEYMAAPTDAAKFFLSARQQPTRTGGVGHRRRSVCMGMNIQTDAVRLGD